MSSTKKGGYGIWLLVAAAVAAFFMIRMGRAISFALLIAVVSGAIGYFLFRLIRDYRHRKAFLQSATGKLETRVHFCKEQIGSFKNEIKNIETSIGDLQTEMNQPLELNRDTWTNTSKLLDSFKKEKRLREAKINFYESCVVKLQTLQHNRRLTEKLSEKISELKQLREQHYEELADMEAMKTEIAYEEGFFQSFDELSLRLLKTESLSDTEVLQKELDKMIGEI